MAKDRSKNKSTRANITASSHKSAGHGSAPRVKAKNNSQSTAQKKGAARTGASGNRNDKAGRSGRQAEPRRLNPVIISLAAVLTVALIVSIVAVVYSYVSSKSVDYLKDDLSKYITISRDDYSSFDVNVTVDKVDERSIENAILQALCKNKDKTPLYDGKLLKNQEITAGDTVYIWYRGYTVDEDGLEIDFNGGYNLSGIDPTELEIGGGKFIEGFELGLLGKNPKDYSTFSKRTEGAVGNATLVQLTYTAAYPDGSSRYAASTLVNLKDNACDKIFGDGFAALISGAVVGEQIKDPFIGRGEGDDGDTFYADMTVTTAYETGDNPLTVSAHFPYNYGSEELRGLDVYFDVYVEKAQLYKTPELNDDFVYSTLKLTEEELSSYKGESGVEKYREYVRAQLELEYEDAVTAQIEEAMLEHFASCVTVKKLPEKEVEEYYQQYVYEMEQDYAAENSNFTSSYGSLDEYANTILDLERYENWRDVLRERAELIVTDKLTFYYVARAEGFILSDEELDRRVEQMIDEYLAEYLVSVGCEREDFDSDEKYEQTVARYREELVEYYNESYFEENVRYAYAADKMREFAKLKYID